MTDGGVDRAIECTGNIQASISALECTHDVFFLTPEILFLFLATSVSSIKHELQLLVLRVGVLLYLLVFQRRMLNSKLIL